MFTAAVIYMLMCCFIGGAGPASWGPGVPGVCPMDESSLMISWLLTSHHARARARAGLRLKVQEMEEQMDEGEERVNPLEGEELGENVVFGGRYR